MHQHERHLQIVERARAAATIEVTALAEDFDVTPETIRRDLTHLERRGLVRRVHGGAIAVERLGFEPTVDAKLGFFAAEKQRIALAALHLLPENGSILIDSGTTTAQLADALPVGRELTVVTNSVVIAAALSSRDDITLHMLGGSVRPRTRAAVGTWTVAELASITVDVAFLGTNGVSVKRGLTTPDQTEAAAKAAMVAAAQRVVVLVDRSKIGQNHFARFAEVNDVDVIVSDAGLDQETADAISAAGPEVIRA